MEKLCLILSFHPQDFLFISIFFLHNILDAILFMSMHSILFTEKYTLVYSGHSLD